jgi:drug/metabolite transporter (DMT)-like permease
MMTPARTWLGAVCALGVLGIWSSFILIARFSATRTLTPFDLAFVRFLFSGVVVLPFALARWPLPRLDRTQIAALAATAGIGYCTLAYSGFFFAPAAHASVLLPGSLPLWTAIIAAVLIGQRISRARAAGLALIVAGDLLVGGPSLLQAFGRGTIWKGDLLFLSASIAWGTYTVLCRKWRVGAVEATSAIALGCLVSYVPIFAVGAAAGWWPTHLPRAAWHEIVYQAIFQGGCAMLLAGLAYTQVISTFGPLRTVMVTSLVPVISALAAVPLLHEPLGALPLLGLLFVTAGLLTGLRDF